MCTSTDATCSIGTSTYGIGTSLTLMVVLLTSSYCQQYDSCGHLIIIPDICHGSTGHTRGEKNLSCGEISNFVHETCGES